MRKLDFRSLLTALVAAVLNRSILLMMNPFGIAYFASAYMHKPGRGLLLIASLAGMATAMPVKALLKYAGVMLGIIIVEKILKICKKTPAPWIMAIAAGVLVSGAGVAYSIGLNGFDPQSLQKLAAVNLLEGVAVVCLVLIFNKAVTVLLRKTDGEGLTNEEQLSLGMLIAAGLYSFNSYPLSKYSAAEVCIFFLILYMGYRYGSGASTVAGACIGTVLALQQNDIGILGYMCLTGVVAGAFREKGKFVTALAQMAAIAAMGYLGAAYMLKLTTVRGVLAGTLLFLLIPERLMKRAGIVYQEPEKYTEAVPEGMMLSMKRRLKDFSEAFKKLSQTFNEGVRPRVELSDEEVEDAFDELTQNVCAKCSRCEYCWEREYYDTFHAANNILDYYSKNGYMEKGQLPISFKRRCINIDGFMNETSRVIELAKVNLNWKNKLMESRLAVAGQFFEVADIIDDFSESLEDGEEIVQSDTKRLKQKLAARKVKVKDLTIMERVNKKTYVYMTAKMKRGRFVTAREICDMLKEVLDRDFVLGKGCRMVVSKEYMTYEFVEDTHYKTIEGVARAAKADEEVSGDAYTLMHLDSGQLVMSLSDGMGSGTEANEESEYIIRLMEQLMETGFGKHAAVRLINSMMFLKSDKQAFSTIDMGMADLYTGKCEFIKIGAAASFIKHDGNVECISSSTLPVGAFTELDYEGITRSLTDGDIVIMVTDGIINNLEDETGSGEEKLKEYIASLTIQNPQEIADAILARARSGSPGPAGDDMSVLACGFYENTK